jgi:hypothetical protein
MFSGGQLVSGSTQSNVSLQDIRSMPPRVRQMLETTAGTTGASILPPLSPAPNPNEQVRVDCGGNGHQRQVVDDFDSSRQHHGPTTTSDENFGYVGHRDGRKEFYSQMAPLVGYEKDFGPTVAAMPVYRTSNGQEFMAAERRPSDSKRLTEDVGFVNPVWRRCDPSPHILPNVASYDADGSATEQQWDLAKRNRVEEWRRGVASSCGTNVDEEEGMDGRLVMVLDSE